ncbi:MAG: HEPN domain-containing protein [Patescibacteria group bacterium]|jgi:HEPN domain-containing protein
MKNNYKKLVKYWQETAAYDYDTMKSLVKSQRYASSLFFGHIVLEKILKALVVNETKAHAPYTHNLILLIKISKIKLNEEEMDLLKAVNDFNIEARYPEYKLKFYKLCTKEYAKNKIEEIDNLYKKLCQKLKPKK